MKLFSDRYVLIRVEGPLMKRWLMYGTRRQCRKKMKHYVGETYVVTVKQAVKDWSLW